MRVLVAKSVHSTTRIYNEMMTTQDVCLLIRFCHFLDLLSIKF